MGSSTELEVRRWRICKADPSGLLMWFDPDSEVPCLRSLPSEQRDDDFNYLGYRWKDGTLERKQGVPLVGGDSDMQLELPQNEIRKAPPDPPEGFLDSLWEGGWDG